MSAQPAFARGVSARTATWSLFGALCAGVPVPAYLFVVLVAPLWVQAAVMAKAADAMTFAVIGAQVAVQALVLYGVARLVVRVVRLAPERMRLPLLTLLCVAAVAPLCFRAYAICYSQCNHASALGVLREFSVS